MTKVVFETASLADAVREAAAVAPSRGEAFDKSAGIVLEIQGDVVVVKASDLRLWYMQWITPISVEGKAVEWRVPSRVFSEVITKLPMGSQNRLTLEQNGTILTMSHGRKRGRFNLMDMESYQRWMPYDPDNMTDAENLAASLSRVDWATSKGNNPPFTGVHITGEALVASDRTKFATVPLKIEGLDRPVTVPSGLLNRVVKNTDLPRIRVEENHLLVMPDDHTQIKCVIYGVDYPDIGRVTVRDRPEYIKIGKSLLLDAMQVAASFIEGDRLPIMRTFWGNEEIAVMLENQEAGHLGDVIDIPGQATHERVEIKFAPENIMGALDHCPAQEIIIGYDPGKLTRPVYINGGDGCEFWVAPTRGLPTDA